MREIKLIFQHFIQKMFVIKATNITDNFYILCI